ncbi:MAG: FKBP-type peptidyl-prolyl cis-trans isomerase [Lysobacteraceae bacterium]|nr:MAG: FKBP-type peptidyl-prolyl cis-trans isomerase [Xanthomonadaceae bacterium]
MIWILNSRTGAGYHNVLTWHIDRPAWRPLQAFVRVGAFHFGVPGFAALYPGHGSGAMENKPAGRHRRSGSSGRSCPPAQKASGCAFVGIRNRSALRLAIDRALNRLAATAVRRLRTYRSRSFLAFRAFWAIIGCIQSPSKEPLLMKLPRNLTLAVATASCALALAACSPPDKDAAGKDAKADAAGQKDAAAKIPGLATEKDQVSYMIGMDIGKSLKPIKDELDMAMLKRAVDDVVNDKTPLLNEEQLAQVMQGFAQKMQAKQQEEMAKKQAEMAAQGKKNIDQETSFLAANGKKPGVVTTASGLQYQIVTQGTGPKPKLEDRVSVHYAGALLDGTEFDSSYKRKEPAQFVLTSVVPGWTEALQLMPVGSKYKLWIPAKLGYGETGTPGGPIPPYSTLVFDVELVDIVKQ